MKKRHPYKKNILIVNIARLGDMLQATPTIAGLKEENPDAKVTVLVEQQFSEVCHHIPYIDEIVSINLSLIVRALSREGDGIVDAYEYLSSFIDDLRSRDFDYCLNVSSSAYTALFLNMLGIEGNGGWTADNEGYRKIEGEWARLFAASVFHQNRQFNSLNLVDTFRCSADVDKHPERLLLTVQADALQYSRHMVESAPCGNDGPLIALQAGASQGKRQWSPSHFAELIQVLVDELNARVVLIGSPKELSIILPIAELAQRKRVIIAAGRTNIPQLAALLSLCDITVTGDTGPMHVSVAVDTPVISMFLASAYGFETGPYHAESIVLQPIIGCGPCNPNKLCSNTECHDTITPRLLLHLVRERLKGPLRELTPEIRKEAGSVIVYRTVFDENGFSLLKAVKGSRSDPYARIRMAYRKLWLEDIGGFSVDSLEVPRETDIFPLLNLEALPFDEVIAKARKGQELIEELMKNVKDPRSSTKRLSELNDGLALLDREIEDIGYAYTVLGVLVRMFVFGKENLQGTDAIELASQMREVYNALERRTLKLSVILSESGVSQRTVTINSTSAIQ